MQHLNCESCRSIVHRNDPDIKRPSPYSKTIQGENKPHNNDLIGGKETRPRKQQAPAEVEAKKCMHPPVLLLHATTTHYNMNILQAKQLPLLVHYARPPPKQTIRTKECDNRCKQARHSISSKQKNSHLTFLHFLHRLFALGLLQVAHGGSSSV